MQRFPAKDSLHQEDLSWLFSSPSQSLWPAMLLPDVENALCAEEVEAQDTGSVAGPAGSDLCRRPDPPAHPLPANGWKIATLVLSAVLAIFVSLLALLLAGQTFTHVVAPPSVTQKTLAVSATAHLAVSPTTRPTAPWRPVSTLINGVLTENQLLTCSGCDDPIHMTISTIQVDQVHGQMIWNNTVQVVAGSGISYAITAYNLQASISQVPVAALLSQKSAVDIQALFAFVPLQTVTYTLSVVINVYRAVKGVIPLNPTSTLIFDPLAVTF